jgi:hypothetical protein
MGGNLWHWTTTTFVATNGAEAGQTVNMVRGGSWYSTGASCKTYDIGEGRSATGAYNSVGFRVAMIPLAVSTQSLLISTSSSFADGYLGTFYTLTLAATGGTAPYTWSLISGALPSGLSLSSGGVLSGTPISSASTSFTLQVTDGVGATAGKIFLLTIAPYGALHHFTWDYVPSSANAGAAIGVRLTARDAVGNLISNFNGSANLTARSGTVLATPTIITEVTPASENQIELQNVTGAAVDTSGWFVRIGDSTTNSVAGMNTPNTTTYNLPSSLAAGQLLRITESTTNTSNGRVPFGSSIGWVNTPGNRRGWVALFDATNTLRDFFTFGWTATDLANFSITVNSQTITLGSQWSGAGTSSSGSVPGQTYDSFQRTGASDNNSTADWAWKHNADNTDATSFGVTNTGLTIPWPASAAMVISPAAFSFVNGEFTGYVTVASAASNVTLTATDGSSHTGTSTAITVGSALISTADDGIPDAWKVAHGFSASANIALLDSDGDGMSNLAEYQAGTDPQSSASKLAIISLTMPAARQMVVTWNAVAGKIYRVSTSPDLVNWTPMTQLLATVDGPQSVTITTGGASGLFAHVEILP